MIRIPRVLTWSPAGLLDARVAVAGSRAGGLGVLDLGSRSQAGTAIEALNRIGSLLKRQRFGVRFRAEGVDRAFLNSAPENLALVTVAGRHGLDWAGLRGAISETGRVAMAEVTSREAAAEAVAAGFEAIVVTGNEAGGLVASESSFDLLRAVLAQSPPGCRVWVRGGIGRESAAVCVAAGAAGVVLDGALLLTRESPLKSAVRERIARPGGVETSVFRTPDGREFGVTPPRNRHSSTASAKPDRTGTAGSAGKTRRSGPSVGTHPWPRTSPERSSPSGGSSTRSSGRSMRARRRTPTSAPRRGAPGGGGGVAGGHGRATSRSSAWRRSCRVRRRSGGSGRTRSAGATRSPRSPPTAGTGGSITTPTRRRPTRSSSRWGGFVPEIPFDPLHYGMPPASLPSIEPLHLLTLEVVRAALDDAGYRVRPFPRERTAVVLGAGGGRRSWRWGTPSGRTCRCSTRSSPARGPRRWRSAGRCCPEWTEDSFPGILLNVAAGRIANRFDLGGANYTVDAACGSSLAAAALAVRELESGAADMVILGGADTVQNPFTYLAFSKTHAFSPAGPLPAVRRQGRRDRDQRGRGGRRPQAAGRRRARRRPDLLR